MTQPRSDRENRNADAPATGLAFNGADLIRRVDAVAHHGTIGDQTLWAPGHRPIHASGSVSVMWELLAEPGTLDEIARLVADEYRIALAAAFQAARESVLRLWTSGVLEIEGTALREAPSTATLPPNP